MNYKLKFRPVAAKDLHKLVKKDKELGAHIINGQIPQLLNNPYAGRAKHGDLEGIRSKDFNFRGITYRILYEINDDIVRIYAVGIQDVAYRKAKTRKRV
jgi:mRNA-degrading endonuclease RelE of RelBE toxin-antitoxin system